MSGRGYIPAVIEGLGSIFVDGSEYVTIGDGDPEAVTQPAFFIDPVGGDDDADGATALTPIQSHQVMMDRIGNQIVNVPVVVTLMGDMPATNPVRGTWRLGSSGKLTYTSSKTLTVLYTGTLSGATPINAPTNQTQEITAVGAFTAPMLNTASGPLVRVRLTSGASTGALGYPTTSPGANIAETGPFSIPDQSLPTSATPPATVSPAGTETIVIETDLLYIADFHLEIDTSAILTPTTGNATWVLFKDLALYAPGALSTTRAIIETDASHGTPPEIIFSGCDVGQLQPHGASIGLVNCLNSQTEIDYGQIQVRGGVVRSAIVMQGASTRSQFLSDVLFAGSLGGKLVVEVAEVVLQRAAFVDSVGGAGVGDGILIRTGCNVLCQSIQGINEAVYGNGNAQLGVHCQAGATLSYQSVKPTVTGTAGDASVGGVVKPWAEIPYGNSLNYAWQVGLIGAVTQNVTRYLLPNYAESATDISGYTAKRAGVIENLRVDAQTAPGGADTQIITVMVNGVATAITATLTGAGVTASDTTNSVVVAAGDRISFRSVGSATTLAANLRVALEYYASDSNMAAIMLRA